MSVTSKLKINWSLSKMVMLAAIAAAMIASVSGFFALYQLNLTKKNSETLTEVWLPKVGKTGEISSSLMQLRKSEWELLSINDADAAKKVEESIDESVGNITIYGKSLSNLISEPEMQKHFDSFSDSWDKYQEFHDKFLADVKAKKINEAKVLLNGESAIVF